MDHVTLGIGIAIGMVLFHLWLLINEDDHTR
jgi:hypothetical protein